MPVTDDARRLIALTTRTGTCQHCGKPIFGKRSDAKYCAPRCNVAACRVRRPRPRPSEEIERLKAELKKAYDKIKQLEARLSAVTVKADVVKLAPIDPKKLTSIVADKYIRG